MEFVDLSRYLPVNNSKLLSFSELRKMSPVWVQHDLQLVEESKNIEYAKSLSQAGIEVVPIRREPPTDKYLNRVEFPRRILFEMTSNCNYFCRMCPQHNLKRPRMDILAETYIKIVDEIDKHGVEGLYLYHIGEALLHPNFKDILEHVNVKKHLGAIWLSTNGEFFTEDKVNFVLNSNIDWINYSAHAVTRETYYAVIGKDKFDTVQSNLENYYSLKGVENLPRKPFLHCQMIEQESTKHEVDLFISKHYKRAEVVSINMLEFANLPNNNFGFQQRERKPLKNCLRVERNDCFIFSNGVVTLCDAAYNGEIYLGNINEQSLYDIWNGDKRKEVLKLNEEGRMSEIEFCRECSDYDI